MMLSARTYDHARDFEATGRFLIRTYRAEPSVQATANWLQPRWEYMHYHPLIERVDRSSIGVWERGDQIVALVHPEHGMGQAYFQIDPTLEADRVAARDLRRAMLTHAEQNLTAATPQGRKLTAYVDDRDSALQELAIQRGYRRTESGEPMTRMAIPDSAPCAGLPDGFGIKSLADLMAGTGRLNREALWKVHRVLWKGFNHGDNPAEEGVEEALRDRRFMQSAPNFEPELNIVVVAPSGEYACYAGLWYEPEGQYGYVEPVATDPAYRRRGLARAAILESLRRAGRRGAQTAYVGSTLPLYLSLGFREISRSSAWEREWPD